MTAPSTVVAWPLEPDLLGPPGPIPATAADPRPAPAPRPPSVPAPATRPPWRRTRSTLFGILLAVGIAAIAVGEYGVLGRVEQSVFWRWYGLAVTTFVLTRFLLAVPYRPRPAALPDDALPTVTVVVPVMNEQDVIGLTLRQCLDVDYPHDKLQIVVVDDCSTDRSRITMWQTAARHRRVEVVTFRKNLGKRYGMAAGFARARGEILVFVDSDSFLEPGSLRAMVAYFADPRVGAVCGHTDVANPHRNPLTRLQAVRYYVAFRLYKSAEALFGSVSCCSGCFAAYRRQAVEPVLDRWLTQRFLGVQCNYGDDRSLTNLVLRKWTVLYAPDARASTVVPHRGRVYLRQQLRWAKSWLRETLLAAGFVWRRRHPVYSLSFYVGFALTLLGPHAVLHALLVQPLVDHRWPWWYLGGIGAVCLLYGSYLLAYRQKWSLPRGILLALCSTGMIVWMLPWAMATLRDAGWGTRGSGGRRRIDIAATGVAAFYLLAPTALQLGLR
jgi:hyaluronan synthase